MFALTEFSRRTQQTLCLLMSAVIVAFTLAAAVYPAAHVTSQSAYSVTVTQIQ